MELTEIKTLYSSDRTKIVLGEYKDKQFLKKTGEFSQEAALAISSLNSPYVAKIFEVGENYIITEYAEGFPLSERKIPKKDVFSTALELCDAISALHEKNIIHRDIKPSNIIMCENGHIKLIDFDAARLKKPAENKDTRFIGTDGFAPPEQYGFMQTDERSDIYSFGVTLKMLLGEDFGHIPYRRVIEKCTRFNPDERYPSIKAVKFALLQSRIMPFIIAGAAVAVCIAAAVLFAKLLPSADDNDLYSSFSSEYSAVPSHSSSAHAQSSYSSLSVEESSISSDISSSSFSSLSISSSHSSSSKSSSSSSSSKSSSSSSSPKSSSNSSSSRSSSSSSSSRSYSSSSSSKSSSSSSSSRSSSNSSSSRSSSSSSSSSSSNKNPSEIVQASEAFPVFWETLTLPNGFPKLSDTVLFYDFTPFETEADMAYRIEIDRKELSTSEINAIDEKLKKWFGSNAEFTANTDDQGRPSLYYNNSDYSANLYYYSLTDPRWMLELYGKKSVQLPELNLKFANPTITPNSERLIKWEDKEVPDELPKLTDYVSEATVYHGDYEIHWYDMSFSEAQAVCKKLVNALDEYSFQLQFSNETTHSHYSFNFIGKLNGKERSVYFDFSKQGKDGSYTLVGVREDGS